MDPEENSSAPPSSPKTPREEALESLPREVREALESLERLYLEKHLFTDEEAERVARALLVGFEDKIDLLLPKPAPTQKP